MGIGISKKIDLKGKRFGRLVVIEEIGKKRKEVVWRCRCDCGNIVDVQGYNLRSGHTKSCGCYMRDRIVETCKKYNTYDLNGEYGIGYTDKGYQFIFDKEDYELIKDFYWEVSVYGYVCSRDKGKTIMLHRKIMGITNKKVQVDHIFHNKLDNRKSKLRITTNKENAKNRIPKNELGVNGVSFDIGLNKWKAQITCDYKNYYLGHFDSREEAISCRKSAEEKLFGEYAYKEDE